MDRLSAIIDRYSLKANVFYAGAPSGTYDFSDKAGVSHLHLVRNGTFDIHQSGEPTVRITEPSIVFYPRPLLHRFTIAPGGRAEVVCIEVEFGAGLGNPVLNALASRVIIPLADIPSLSPVTQLFCDEAFNSRCGRQAAIDRLAACLLILLLRNAIESQLVTGGVLTGLADPKLAKAITAIHDRPEYNWSVEELAQTAGMSRARFAAHFRAKIGTTPLDYLTDWRISVAQTLLKTGKSIKLVAPLVGYSHPSAFARVFTKSLGVSPREWQTKNC